jgi:DUF1680 family protein
MKATLEDWIPRILAAQEPDGYLQTRFTLDPEVKRWDDRTRSEHEGYVAGYFLESAINHYMMTNRNDARMHEAAKKLADCWCENIGPAPKKEWFDGHQEMEQALVRFGRFVNDMEGAAREKNISKWPVDPPGQPQERRRLRPEPLAVVQQYEAVGHAVRAIYTYSGMAVWPRGSRFWTTRAPSCAVGQSGQQEVLCDGWERQW